MTSFLLGLLGLCLLYQVHRFSKANMPLFATAYSFSIALMLAGFVLRWPDVARLLITAVAMALLFAGAYQLHKHPNA